MLQGRSYPNIDLNKTGEHLKELIRQKGYSVKEIQNFLHLSCPQPVYRWFRGQMMPTVDHLHALSMLLHVHMEDLLVVENIQAVLGSCTFMIWQGDMKFEYDIDKCTRDRKALAQERLRLYQKRYCDFY